MQLHLNTYGAYLHVKDQLFEVKMTNEGKPEKHHVAAHKVKSIWMAKGTALSTDAVHLAIKNNIDIVFLEYDGFPIGRVWHTKLGSTTLIRKKQLEASLDRRSLTYTSAWLGRKLFNQSNLLLSLKKHRPQHSEYLTRQAERVEVFKLKIAEAEGEHIKDAADKIRAWEGNSGRVYFETLSYVLPKHHQFSGRSFRPAGDPFNAFLNYAYGMLYSKVEKSLILAGLDPFVGFLHRDDYNYKSLVYDFIEPYRVFAEKVVFNLFSGRKVRQDHYDEITGGVRLNKSGKVLLIEAFNKYFEEDRVRYLGKNRLRVNIIQTDAHRFAGELIGRTEPE